MNSIQDLNQIFSSTQSVVIFPHTKPDADALGSSLALARVLEKRGHEVRVISPSDYPHFLNWMVGQEQVIQLTDDNEAEIKDLIEKANVIFCLDFNDLKRIGQLGEITQKARAKKVLIDHHLEKTDFADFEYWDTKSSSTAELIYKFLIELGWQKQIDVAVGEAIYAGMMTDTGSFRFAATSPKVHKIIADLMELGIDHSKVHRLVYDNNSLNKLRFLGYALNEKLTFLENFNTAYILLSEAEINQFNYQTGDSEGLVNYALSIKGVVFAALFIEKDGSVKMSFRSVGNFDVNQYARKYFDGGGHKNAAGGKDERSLKEVEKTFLESLEDYKKQLLIESEQENSYASN